MTRSTACRSATTSFAGGGAFRHARDDERIRADDDRRAHLPDGDARPVRLGKALAADLQLAAGDGGGRRDLEMCGRESDDFRRGIFT